jgi:hypothetical protein
LAKFSDGGGEFFAGHGNFFAGEGDALFSGLKTIDQPDFVIKDEGIDQDGVWLGLDDFIGSDGEFFLLELGGVFVAALAGEGTEPICLLAKLLGGLVALVAELITICTEGLFGFTGGEFEAEGDQAIEG